VTAIPRRLRELLGQLSQSLFSLSFNIAGLIAGALLASSFDTFARIPWALIIYPGILTVRGAIGGLFSGRLSTALHLGTIEPRVLNNTREAEVLFDSITTLTLVSGLFMGSVGSVFSVALNQAKPQEVGGILVVIVAAMAISIVFISPITAVFSFYSFRRGLDPDVVVYPVISTVSDVLITLCYMLTLNLVMGFPSIGWWVLGAIDLVFIAFVARNFARNRGDVEYVRTIREFLITLAIVSVIVNVTGSALSRIVERIGSRPEVYMVYPALIDTVGDVGSIVGSTATTKMALGLMETSISSIGSHWMVIGGAWASSLIMFGVYSLVSSAIYGMDLLGALVRQLLLTNLLVVPVIVLISYSVAIVTRMRGLDPDNFIIPIETSLSDGMTTIALLLFISLGVR
jgi:mgtE-like transporter